MDGSMDEWVSGWMDGSVGGWIDNFSFQLLISSCCPCSTHPTVCCVYQLLLYLPVFYQLVADCVCC